MNKPKNYPFVEPEIAKLAKEKGFKEEYYYWPTDGCPLPLYQQLIDWFREEHKIDISWMPNWEYQGSAELYLDGYEFTIQSIEKYKLNPSNVIRGEFHNSLQEAIKKAFTLI